MTAMLLQPLKQGFIKAIKDGRGGEGVMRAVIIMRGTGCLVLGGGYSVLLGYHSCFLDCIKIIVPRQQQHHILNDEALRKSKS
jgi:hypothetical protein